MPAYLAHDPAPRAPRQQLPAGTCDCHFHVFEDAATWPYAQPRSYTPTPAKLAHYRQMADTLGIERAVLVHPSVYGADHTSFEHVLAQCGPWMRGVAVVQPDTPSAAIERWHALGARGTRCNALFAGGAALHDLPAIAQRVRGLDWHLQLLIDVAADPNAVNRVAELGLPVVVDHFGHVPAAQALASPGFNNLLALVREGRAWVKLSGAYRVSADRSRFEDLRPIVDALVQANAEPLVWGSDWPHPAITPPMPNDGALADLLFDWLTPALRRKVLVDNPARLYWSQP